MFNVIFFTDNDHLTYWALYPSLWNKYEYGVWSIAVCNSFRTHDGVKCSWTAHLMQQCWFLVKIKVIQNIFIWIEIIFKWSLDKSPDSFYPCLWRHIKESQLFNYNINQQIGCFKMSHFTLGLVSLLKFSFQICRCHVFGYHIFIKYNFLILNPFETCWS